LIEGEPPVLDGSRSFFNPVEQQSGDRELLRRCNDFDIHPSAPWWGRGPALSNDACAQLESRVLAGYADLCGGLESAGLTQERRALRARAQDLQYAWADDRTLELRFHLSRGVFATTLLAELGICREPVRDTRTS
jgi:tRNA pseudouridine13 synthase